MIAGMVVVRHEGGDLAVEIAGQVVVLEQDAALERPMPALIARLAPPFDGEIVEPSLREMMCNDFWLHLRATRPDRASSSWPTNSYASSRPCRDGSTILSDVRGPTLAIACEPCGRPPGHGEEGFPAV